MTITTGEPQIANPYKWVKVVDDVGHKTRWRRGDDETYSTNTLEQHVTVTEAQQS